jgi:hypothetical protein
MKFLLNTRQQILRLYTQTVRPSKGTDGLIISIDIHAFPPPHSPAVSVTSPPWSADRSSATPATRCCLLLSYRESSPICHGTWSNQLLSRPVFSANPRPSGGVSALEVLWSQSKFDLYILVWYCQIPVNSDCLSSPPLPVTTAYSV